MPRHKFRSDPRRPAKRGRPPLFDFEKQIEYCALIKMGCPMSLVALYVGGTTRTVQYARRSNPQFAHRVAEARGLCELVPMRELRTASRRSWRAIAWYLERIRPRQFGAERPGMRPKTRRKPPDIPSAVIEDLLARVSDCEEALASAGSAQPAATRAS